MQPQILTKRISSAYQLVIVTGNSMSPAIADGQRCVLNRWIYRLTKPERMDNVIYKDNGKYVVGRIMAKPKEEVEIVQGIVMINGSEVDYHYIPPSVSIEKATGGDNMYFIVKDNMTAGGSQEDLRQITDSQLRWIHKKNIMGKIVK